MNSNIYDKPYINNNLKRLSLEVKDCSGAKFKIKLTGNINCHLNPDLSDGFGSDDVYCLCRYNDKYGLLIFSSDVSAGTGWLLVPIIPNTFSLLKYSDDSEVWSQTCFRDKPAPVHPCNIDNARRILSLCLEGRDFTEADLYGTAGIYEINTNRLSSVKPIGQVKRLNENCRLGRIYGLVSILCPIIYSILSLFFSIKGLKEIKVTGQDGRKEAITGIILSIFTLIIYGPLLIVWIISSIRIYL